jgi:hypothetical protein
MISAYTQIAARPDMPAADAGMRSAMARAFALANTYSLAERCTP